MGGGEKRWERKGAAEMLRRAAGAVGEWVREAMGGRLEKAANHEIFIVK